MPRAERLRDALSTVAAIQTLALALEACGLARDVLPLRYLARVPAVRALGTGSHAVRIPDLFALLTAGFWGPVAVWVVVGVVVPVMGGWFFNVGLGAGRRGGGRRTVDPLAFAVVRGLLAWAVYGRGVGAEWVGREWVVGVEGSVPAGWRGMCVGAGVGGVMAVYEAVLRG